MVQSISGKIRIPNHTDFPIGLKRNEHIAQISSTYIPVQAASQPRQNKSLCSTNKQTTLFSNNLSIDPNKILSPDTITTFKRLHKEFDHVFSNTLKGYNGAVGPLTAVVNMGSVLPPQRKEKLPQYARNRLEELQLRFTELESTRDVLWACLDPKPHLRN